MKRLKLSLISSLAGVLLLSGYQSSVAMASVPLSSESKSVDHTQLQNIINLDEHLSADPIVSYSFDLMKEGSDAVEDESGHAHNGTLHGNDQATIRTGKNELGKSIEFVGPENYIAMPDLGEMGQFSFSAFVLLKDVQSRPVTTLLDTSAQPGGVKLEFRHSGQPGQDGNNSVKLVFTVNGNEGGDTDGSGASFQNDRFYEHEYTFEQTAGEWTSHPQEAAWFHIGVVYDPDQQRASFYYDGRLDKTVSYTKALTPMLNSGMLGAGQQPNQYLEGAFDNVEIFDKALSDNDMASLASFEKDLWAVREIDNFKPSSTVLYVDGMNGDDHNPGTQTQPFKTVQKGMDSIVRDGTRLIIQPGLYRESDLQLNASGSVDKPIIIEAADPGHTTISGSVRFSDWQPTDDQNVFVHDWAYDWALNTYQGNDIAKRRDMIVVDGEIMRPVLSMNKLDNNTYYLDQVNKKVYLRINKKIDQADVEIPQAEKLFISNNHNYVIMRGLNFENANPYLLDYGVDFKHSKHVLIEDCQFTNFSGMSLGIDHGAYKPSETAMDYVIRRSSFNHNGFDALQLGYRSINMLVEDCELRYNGWRVDWGSYNLPDPAGIKMMFSKDITYRRLDVSDNKIYGLWFDNQNWTITVEDSYISQNRDGMWVEINPQGVVVRNNTFFNNNNVGLNLANSEAVILDHNLFYNFNGLNISHWEENEVRFDGNNANHVNTGGPGTVSKNIRMTNNLFATGVPNTQLFNMQPWQSVYDTMQSANNRYYVAGDNDQAYHFNNRTTGFADFMAAVHDTSSVELAENPFVDGGTASVGFTYEGSTSTSSQAPLNIPVTLSKPIRKEVSVDYHVYDAVTKQLLKAGTLTFKPLQTNRIIYAGSMEDNVLVQLDNPKDIQIGNISTHLHTASSVIPSNGNPSAPVVIPQAINAVQNDGTIKSQGVFDSAAKKVLSIIRMEDLKNAVSKMAVGADDSKPILIEVDKVNGSSQYDVQIPVSALDDSMLKQPIHIVTEKGSFTLPPGMLKAYGVEKAQIATFTIKESSLEAESETVKLYSGGRPLIDLSLQVDGKVQMWNDPAYPVSVSIPYTPKVTENAELEFLTIWYIDPQGIPVAVPSGRYDQATGMVNFDTSHYSKYAVVFVQEGFDDLVHFDWAKHAIEVMASKGVIMGKGNGNYEAASAVTRADFMLLLVRTLGLSAEADSQFADVPASAYYANSLAIAKKLGIAKGIDENRFNPTSAISRQEMMTLMNRALKASGKSLQEGAAIDLAAYKDTQKIASYALEDIQALVKSGLVQGSGSLINPTDQASRAEAAVIMYNLYGYYYV